MKVQERPCRACQSPLQTVLDLGVPALSGFPQDAVAADLPRAPLDLCRCTSCGLVQLRHTVEPDALFRQYWYHSGVNETMRAELADIVMEATKHLGGLNYGDAIADVGANDGTLLSAYPDTVKRIAFEPADNFKETLRQHCDELHDYFPGPFSPAALPARSVRLLTSIACFYATDDPKAFVDAVDYALTWDGVWVVQFQDLHQMLESTAFDNICAEHVFYPCLASVERLLAPFDLQIVDAQRRAINGGSLRLTIGRRWRTVSPRVAELRDLEAGCEDLATLAAFAWQVGLIRWEIRSTLNDCKKRGQIADICGASTKGNTLLQFCGIGPDHVRQAWERSPEKWGRQTITGIPIVSENVGRADPPDILLVLIWQFRDAIIKREAEYLRAGGRLLFPLPRVEMVDASVL
jgi:NDP-4-keto-2,6-dideoxyhexose 3-C-methyltransferase